MSSGPYDRTSCRDFLDFAAQVLPYSYSQRLQDLWFLFESGFFKSGYFVEFGALNGKDFSNSYTLEKLGWKGVIAEPHPDFKDRMKANRKCKISTKCVYSRTGETVTFHVVKGRPALSSVGHLTVADDKQELRSNYQAVPVKTISLADLLKSARAPRVVDCLSIDTEGSEPEILEAYDFASRRINCICVEHNGVSRSRLFDLLSGHGYVRKFESISGHDDWYVHKDAYPDWSSDGAQAVCDGLRSLPPFETAFHERQVVLAEAMAQHQGD